MRAEARAKVNLSLLVRPPDPSGFHPIRSLALSIALCDEVDLDTADDDLFEVSGDAPETEDNLAWMALVAVRSASDANRPAHLRLTKRIPVAAGLGGGSADAAASLVLASRVYGAPEGTDERLAPDLGSDVPFCLHGGFSRLEGRGEIIIDAGPLPDDFVVGLVVPPFELATAAVYRAWDRLEGPAGSSIGGRELPPSLRAHGPLQNDLVPAATGLRPELGDWITDLGLAWGRPVLMSGSGPTLFGLFLDEDEAAGAVGAVPDVRDAAAAAPVSAGVAMIDE